MFCQKMEDCLASGIAEGEEAVFYVSVHLR
jgi:hypothetical protein